MRAALGVLLIAGCGWAQDLTLVQAAISESEGGPAIAEGKQFAPGDRVFLTFRVSGFTKDNDTHQMFLNYSVQAFDAKDIPFEPALEDKLIGRTLRTESRPMTYSFEVPVAPVPGLGKFRIEVQDRLGPGVLKAEVPFSIASALPEIAPVFAIQNFRFYRSEYEDTPLSMPEFRAGDTVWGRFYLSGFEWEGKYRYQLTYGVTLRNADGKTMFALDKAVSDTREFFYPKWHVGGIISVRLEDTIRPGAYVLIINARDETGGKTAHAEFPIRVR